MNVYARLPVAFARGEGAYLYDTEGKAYLDALSGLAVCGLGHAHPAVQETIARQAGTLLHTSNLYQIPVQEALAIRLCELSGMDKVFFGNSGAEANEVAIKLARRFGHNKGVKRPMLVVADGAFHGRTLASLSASGNRAIQAGFEPLVDTFCRVPYNDTAALADIAKNSQNVVAVLLEPVLGEAGVMVPSADYLNQVRALCDEQGWLMMLDEVQTGMGRTGTFFAYQATGAVPDVVTLAKGLANGVPIGACLARGEAADVLQPGNHGSTFGGNPLACATALTVIETMLSEKLTARAASLGRQLQDNLRALLKGSNLVHEIRGRGLMIGIELAEDCPDFVSRALEKGLLVNLINKRIVRLLPPLILTDEQAGYLVETLVELINTQA